MGKPKTQKTINLYILNHPNILLVIEKMGKREIDIESEEEKIEGKKAELLKRKSGRLKCPICGAPARLRMRDGAQICRDGGHIVYVDGRVELPGGIETTLSELRANGVKLYMDLKKEGGK